MENRLLTQPIPRLFGQYVCPAVVAMVLDGVQSMVDGLFIGRYVGAQGMASVNIANPYFQLIIGCSMVVCTGTMSAAGRALGAGDRRGAQTIYRSALWALLGLSALLLGVGLLAPEPLARLLGADAALLPDTVRYIRTLALFVPVIAFKILFGFSGRLMERPRLYLAGTVVTLCANVALDMLAVKGLRLGVTGAAAATGLAYLAGLLVVCRPLLARTSVLNLYDGRFCGRSLCHAVLNGSSEGVTYASAAFTVFVLNRSFMQFAGASGVAAFTIINYIGNFVTLVMFGMSDGISPILSNNYGARQDARLHRTYAIAAAANLTVGVCFCLLFAWWGEPLIRLFVTSAEEAAVVAMAARGARIYGLCFLANGWNILQSGYYTALGQAGASLLIAASRGFVFIALGVLWLPAWLGIDGVWAALPFAEGVTVLLGLLVFAYKRNRRRRHG